MNDRSKVDVLDRRKHLKVNQIALLFAISSSAHAERLHHTRLLAFGESAIPASWAQLSAIPAAILVAAALVAYRRRSGKRIAQQITGREPSPSHHLVQAFLATPEIVTNTLETEIANHLQTPGITSVSLTDANSHRSIPEIVTAELPSPLALTAADIFQTAPKPPASAYHRTSRPPLPLREDPPVPRTPIIVNEADTPEPTEASIQARDHKTPIPFPEPAAVPEPATDRSPLEDSVPARLTPYQRMKRRQVVPIRGKDGRINSLSYTVGQQDSMQQK